MPTPTDMTRPARANIEVEVVKFRPLGSAMTSTVKMTLKPTTAPISLVGNYLIRARKRVVSDLNDPTDEVEIQFLTDMVKHLFIGIAYSKRDFDGDDMKVGQEDFTRCLIENDGTKSIMTVTNTRKNKSSFDYLILIQEVDSGQLGIIDPEIENES